MSDLTTQLLGLIRQNKTVNEISEKLNLTNKQIFNILTAIRNKGFEFDRKYYYDGSIIYSPKNYLNRESNGTDIITSPREQEFDALVISDLHMGSVHERIDILNMIYDYCAKNNIHIIIICGDFIDGTFGKSDKKHDNVGQQIDDAIKNYPFDKNILNFVTLGDHDYSALIRCGQNFASVLENYRHDIAVLGYHFGQINVKNDRIIVKHLIENFDMPDGNYRYCLYLKGHLHKFAITNLPKKTVVTIPSVSEMQFNEDDMLPSAVRMRLSFKNGLIESGVFSQLMIGNKIHKVNEIEYFLGMGKDFRGCDRIKLEEEMPKKRVLTPIKKEEPKQEAKSQIDKFNARWNL